jgi:GH24 family phage-related lysozyme (muramidase)
MYNKKVLQTAVKELDKAKAPAKQKDIITDPMGQWKYPGQVTRIPSDTITMQGVNYPVLGVPDYGQPMLMQPGQDYDFPGANYVDEYPQMKKGGMTIPVVEDAGSMNEDGVWVPNWDAIAEQAQKLNAKTVRTASGTIVNFDDNWQVKNVDDNPEMKRGGGLKSKKYTRNIEGTNRLFAVSALFKKPKKLSKKRIFDPNAKYFQEGGESDFIEADLTDEEIEEYAKGGFIIEDISVPQLTQAQKGLTISDPKEYAYRKAAYDDSMYLYKNNLDPLPKPKHITYQNNSKGPLPYRSYTHSTKFNYPSETKYITKQGAKLPVQSDDMIQTRVYPSYYTKNPQYNSPTFNKYHASKDFTKIIPANKPIRVDIRNDYYHPQGIYNPFTGEHTGVFLPGQNEKDARVATPSFARFKKPVQPVYFKKEGDKKSIQKSYNKAGNYNKNTNPNGWVSPSKDVYRYEKSRSIINKVPTVDPIGKRKIGETSNATINPTTGNVTEVITPNYENLLPLKKLETERRNQIIESKVQQRKQSDYKTAYRDQTIVSYDPTIKQFIQTGSRKAPLPYSEKIGTKDWELNTSQEIPESGPLVWQVNGKDYYNQEEAKKAQAFMPQGSYKFAPGGTVDLNPETMKKYLAALKVQENNESTGFKKNKWYPYPSSEKGTDTIAYGHKLLPGEQKYYQGITTQQAEALAMKDVLEKQTSAKGRVDKKYGEGTFDKLPQDAQMLLVDYQYNVGLQKFPKFVEAVVKGDKPTMLKEYERTSDVGKLTKRNNWTKGVIDELNYPKPKPVKKPKVADANLSNDEFLEAELTPQEIEWYKSQGYTVEELD